MIVMAVAATGRTLSAAELLSVTLRTDCVPVPATLELTAQSNVDTDAELVVGAELLIGEPAISITLIKAQPIKTQMIKDGRRIGGIACVGVLSGCQALIEPTSKALILESGSFAGALRACGAKMAIGQDLPLARFVCLRGGMPTAEIANRLQQEAAIVYLEGGKLSVIKIDTLLKSEPVGKFDPSAVAWIESPKMQMLQTPAFYSIADDGSTVENEALNRGKPVSYLPRLDARQLKNMEKVLICRGSILRPLDLNLQCGRVVQVSGKPYVVLTAAHRVDTGALGGSSVAATKLWLSSL